MEVLDPRFPVVVVAINSSDMAFLQLGVDLHLHVTKTSKLEQGNFEN